MSEIKYDNHNEFLKLFEYNYPYKMDTISFIYQAKDNSGYLKREILTNFITLNLDGKLAYLDQISFDIEKLKDHVWSTKENLEKWFTKYKVPEDFIFNREYSYNPLYGFLQSDMPTFRETMEPDYNPDIEASSHDFYNYYYGQALNKMLDFIAEQKNKIQSSTNQLSSKTIESEISNPLNLKETNTKYFLKLYDNIELGEKSTVMYYNDMWSKFFLDLKNEIQENLIILPKEDRNLYLDSLLNKVNSRLLEFGYEEKDIQKWLSKYKITEDLLWGRKIQDNELVRILESWPPDMEKFELPNFNQDTESIQNDFYNFVLIRNANDLKFFVELQIISINKPYPEYTQSSNQMPATKAEYGFHPLVKNFIQKANPKGKYKSDWSCHGFYDNLKGYLDELEAAILLHFSSITEPNKQLFKDSHIKHIENVSGYFIAGGDSDAQLYLDKYNFSLEEVFERLVFDKKIKPDKFPRFFINTYEQLREKGFDYHITDIHQDFIFLISDYFINKLVSFFDSLPSPDSITISKSTSIPEPKKEKVIPTAYIYKKYNYNLTAITTLLDSLKKHKFVSANTDLKDFRKIFNNTLPNIPIQWLNGIESLAYFVKLLHLHDKLIEEMPKDIWRVTGKLFVDENKNPFEWKKLRTQKQPAKAALLKKAVEHLK
jgi:hypothetical protein